MFVLILTATTNTIVARRVIAIPGSEDVHPRDVRHDCWGVTIDRRSTHDDTWDPVFQGNPPFAARRTSCSLLLQGRWCKAVKGVPTRAFFHFVLWIPVCIARVAERQSGGIASTEADRVQYSPNMTTPADQSWGLF